MSRALRRVTAALAAVAAVAWAAPAPAQAPRAERPTYAVGQEWPRADGTYRVTSAGMAGYVFVAGADQEIRLSRNLGILSVRRGRDVVEFSSAAPMPWPLAAGKWAQSWVRVHTPQLPAGADVEILARVTAYEDVSLGGRVTKAFRIDYTLQRDARTREAALLHLTVDPALFTWEFSMWYAPESKTLVRGVSAQQSLLSFEPAGAGPPPAVAAPMTPPVTPPGPARVADPGASSGTPPRAGRPSYAMGDRWVLGDGVYELTRIDGDTYVFATAPGREIHVTRDLGIAKIVRDGRSVLSFDRLPALPWPLEVGRWAIVDTRMGAESSASLPMSSAQDLRVTAVVEAFEAITVPAGAVSAFRIVYTITGGTPGASGTRYGDVTVWYAPAVQRIVRMTTSGRLHPQSLDVVAFEGDAAPPMRIAMAAPADQARVTADSVQLRGTVTAGQGLARVTVTLNGAEIVRRDEAASPKPEIVLDVPVRLIQGRNLLIVTATDVAGLTQQQPLTLFFDRPAPVASAAPVPAAPAAPAVPLAVRLASPADGVRLDRDSVVVAGLVSGGAGVSRVVVTVNGVEAWKAEPATPSASVPVNVALTLREGQNIVVVTATDAGRAHRQEIRTVHYERVVPLTVAMSYPADNTRLSQESTVVVASAASSRGVSRVTVTLNGVTVHEQADPGTQRSAALTAPVKLQEGANVIVVTAVDAGGAARQAIRTVFFDRPAVAVAVPPAPAVPARTQWAVIIGIGRYDSAGIQALKYSVADAEAVYQTLTGPGGFKKEHVLLLTDRTERKPTLRNIKWALGTFLGRSAQRDDTVVIYYAGHGAPEVDPRGIERDGLAKYLIPSDADPEDLFSTALPMDDLQTIFQRIEAERVVAFLDACYSGAAGGRTFLARKTRAGTAVDDLFLERLTRSKGRAIITASRTSEVSIELPELGHGIFTYYLVQGLKGAADLDRDGIVNLQELYQYLEQQVTRKSRAVGGNQHPVMKGELEGGLPLVKVGGR